MVAWACGCLRGRRRRGQWADLCQLRRRQSFDYAVGPVPQLDTVQLDTHHGGCEFLDAEAQLMKYRTVLDRMESCALGPADSHKVIEHIMKSL